MRFFLPDIRTRSVVTEYMDDPGADARLLYRTLSQFKLINILFSRIRHILTRTVVSDMKQHACHCYSILDLGSGGCDIPMFHNSFAIADGRTSILRGFTYQEICAFLKEAHIEEYAMVRTISPSRIYIWCTK